MFLPSSYRFSVPTVLLVADRMRADLYRLYGDRLDLLMHMDNDAFPIGQSEKYSIELQNDVHAGGEDEKIRERAGRAFFREIGRKLHLMRQKNEFVELIVAAPKEQYRQLFRSMSPDVQQLLSKSLPSELRYEHPLAILERIRSKYHFLSRA